MAALYESAAQVEDRRSYDYATAHPGQLVALPGTRLIQHDQVRAVKFHLDLGIGSFEFSMRERMPGVPTNFALKLPAGLLAAKKAEGVSKGAAVREYVYASQTVYQNALPPDVGSASRWLK